MRLNATTDQINLQPPLPCQSKPKVSALQYIHGIFDFAAHPLALLGSAMQMYVYLKNMR